MVAHEAIGVDLGVEAIADVLERLEKIPAICIVPEYRAASGTPIHDVVPRPFKLDPQRSCYEPRLIGNTIYYKT